MYSFEGDFRRKPVQSLGGRSKGEDKNVLLQRAQEYRRKREADRLSEYSSVVVQSFFRGCRDRERTRQRERQQFDQTSAAVKRGNPDVPAATLCELCRQIIFFFRPATDGQRLVWLCQLMVKQQKTVITDVFDSSLPGPYRLQRILTLCCRYLEYVAEGSTAVAMPLRMLEVFTRPAVFTSARAQPEAGAALQRVVNYLIQNGYYTCMRQLLRHRVPDSLEHTVTPPTPLAASLLELIKAPLQLLHQSKDADFKSCVLASLCTEFFSAPYTPQIREFLLPALAYSHHPLPFTDLLHVLQPLCRQHVPMDTDQGSRVSVARVKPSPWVLHMLLTFAANRIGQLSARDIREYLLVLHSLVPTMQEMVTRRRNDVTDSDDDSDDDMLVDRARGSLEEIAAECLVLLNSTEHVEGMLRAMESADSAVLTAMCTVCHALAVQNKFAVNSSKLMYTMALNHVFLRNLWHACVSVTTKTVTGEKSALILSLSRGLELTEEEMRRIVPLLSVFCSLFSYSLLSLHDREFYGEVAVSKSSMPFRLDELVPMSKYIRDACLGIIELAHPETRPEVAEEYKRAFQSVGVTQRSYSAEELRRQHQTWSHLFKVLSQLIKQLYARDSRRPFCPAGHWLSHQVNIQADQPFQFYKNADIMFQQRSFGTLGALNPNREVSLEDGPPLSTKEARKLTILQELPFVVAFSERIKIFNRLVQQDRMESQGSEVRHFIGGPSINIQVRRNYLYEDAFERLSPDNEPNLKLRMQVQLKNFAGVNEAGIDGGGLFREFIWELLKTAFDPNRGLFKSTTDKLLYPNPYSKKIMQEQEQDQNFKTHYFFLGRILGKALYEGMLVELPFASFFLSKLLSRHRGDVDIDHLASLDPDMYKNLLFLKHYDGDVAELNLDFTVTHNEFGKVEEEELKPGGKSIMVNNSNRVEYIHRMADYMLNKRIRAQCDAFREGLSDVINMEWLRMFNHNELQVLISGAPVPIDIQDLRHHTNYSGGYADDHPVIKTFWEVVEGFTEEQKRFLLKFVTSCSRPPLLGFKDLFPVFCIHHAGKDPERLPTASTCMNLLKLPEFTDKEIMTRKLVYAVESGAGFELS